MTTRSGFFGVYPMVYALFDKTGALSRHAMHRQVEAMLRHGVQGVLRWASQARSISYRPRSGTTLAALLIGV